MQTIFAIFDKNDKSDKYPFNDGNFWIITDFLLMIMTYLIMITLK